MAVTINASLTNGLVQTADTSGVLNLQTAGTTAVTVDASQNVGVGTASPRKTLSVGTLLDIYSGAASSPTVQSIRANGNNLVLNANSTGITFLNYDTGSGGVSFGNGASSAVATMSSTGVLTTNLDANIASVTVGRGGGAVATNTAVGVGALAANTTGSTNTALGYAAGYSNTGSGITAVGYRAGYYSTTGGNSTYLGYEAGFGTVGGGDTDYSVAVGYRALYTVGANTDSNTAIGSESLYSTTTGGSNTAVGRQSLYSNTTASNNTAVGYQAGYTNITGAQNVLLGTRAGYLGTNTSYKVMMGYEAGYSSSFSGDSFNTFIGTQAGYFITSGIKNTILGGYNGNQGGLDIRTASNYIVLSDGDGNPLVSTNSTSSVALNGATPKTGTGITFPATQSASTDANTLDDYEEGTWTPNQGSGLTVVGAYTSVGYYTKVGRVVTVYARQDAATSLAASSTNTIISTNLPFPVLGGNQPAGGLYTSVLATGLAYADGGTNNTYNVNTIAATKNIYYSFTYFTS